MKEELPEHELLVFTGPIDAYFASQVQNKIFKVRAGNNNVLPRACPSLSTEAYFGRKSTWNHRHPKSIVTVTVTNVILIVVIVVSVAIVIAWICSI